MKNMAIDRERLDKNFNYLLRHTKGAVFSFTESTMKDAVRYMAGTPMGARILSSLEKPPKISSLSSSDKPGDLAPGALYKSEENHVYIATGPLKTDEGLLYACRHVNHEALHALQSEQGVLHPKGVSLKESVFLEKLCESEAKGVSEVTVAGVRWLDEGGKNINGGITKFVNADIVHSYRLAYEEKGIPFDEEKFKETNADYLLQQALKATRTQKKINGKSVYVYNRGEAERIAVGKIIKHTMNLDNQNISDGDKKWQTCYDKQALASTEDEAKKGNITTKGNPDIVNKALKRIDDLYAVPPETFKGRNGELNLNLSAEGKKAFRELETKVKARGDLSKGDANRAKTGRMAQSSLSEQAIEDPTATPTAAPVKNGGLNSRLAQSGIRVGEEINNPVNGREGYGYC